MTEPMTSDRLLLIDCDGTCYPWIPAFNGCFKQALKDTATEWGISTERYEAIGTHIRGVHQGMMNFILALCQGDTDCFQAFTRDWCNKLDYTLIQPDPGLCDLLSSLPVPACIFTNNCRTHLDRVWGRLFGTRIPSIRTLTIEDTYDGHWFYPKQSPDSFTRICQKQQVTPQKTLLLDDSPLITEIARRHGLEARLITKQYPLISCLRELIRT